MKLSFFCMGVVFAGAAALGAQQSAGVARVDGASQRGSLTLVLPGPERSCPAAMLHATQGSSSQILRAGEGQSQPLMMPTLTLTPPKGRTPASAVVTAHGLPPTAGAMDLVGGMVPEDGAKAKREITRTLTVKLVAGENGSYSAVLQLPGFTTVRWIHLDAVTYADGSTWKADSDAECRVTPDPLVLIGGR